MDRDLDVDRAVRRQHDAVEIAAAVAEQGVRHDVLNLRVGTVVEREADRANGAGAIIGGHQGIGAAVEVVRVNGVAVLKLRDEPVAVGVVERQTDRPFDRRRRVGRIDRIGIVGRIDDDDIVIGAHQDRPVLGAAVGRLAERDMAAAGDAGHRAGLESTAGARVVPVDREGAVKVGQVERRRAAVGQVDGVDIARLGEDEVGAVGAGGQTVGHGHLGERQVFPEEVDGRDGPVPDAVARAEVLQVQVVVRVLIAEVPLRAGAADGEHAPELLADGVMVAVAAAVRIDAAAGRPDLVPADHPGPAGLGRAREPVGDIGPRCAVL